MEEPITHRMAFEDSSIAIDIARLPKICPRTKYINVFFHPFRDYLRKGLIHIQQVSRNGECAEACTKPSPHNIFLKHRKIIFGF